MKSPNILLQVLPILTITLCMVFFIIYKILSRIKSQALGHPAGGKSFEFKPGSPEKMPAIERFKLECPAIIERSGGFTRVGIKEITLNGAFVTCPRPFPVGEKFQIKIIPEKASPLALDADVLWNNQNVPRDQIVSRGMKIRFLQLSEDDRQNLNDIVGAA